MDWGVNISLDLHFLGLSFANAVLLFWDDSDKLVLYGGAIRYEIVFNYYLLENTKTCCLYTQTD